MKYLNLNLTEELTHLLTLTSQIGVHIRWFNQDHKNVGHQFLIHILSETLIASNGICDQLLHGNNPDLLIKYSNQLLSMLNDRLDEASLSPLHDRVIPNAQDALRSIISKISPCS
ncbi:hypothetical protein [Acinetobacter sp. HZNU-JH01]|uniref:hypothetical protein n=1 Tax=Acinetobacter sp. HZNU-JH01 TaxID=3136280 RepID=UPI0030F4231D